VLAATVSAERFFDDLARTLAEPMPRRRAVRVIGVSLAAITVPGLSPRLARAQTGVCGSTTCGKDQRCCQKGAEANFKTYCCPSPSWQFFCGSQDNGYRCVNTCAPRAKKIPCTALIAHPESGINGICCDKRLHSGCVRVGAPAEKRPDGTWVSEEWKPSCCPKGPGFAFCFGDDTCCQAPNKCKRGLCRCPNGTQSCDGRKCCKRGENCSFCVRTSTAVSTSSDDPASDIVGRKCCPRSAPYCCGSTCCKELGCCGTKCCAHPAQCAKSGAARVCCPSHRVTVADGHYGCCPAGTASIRKPDGRYECI
jgi:hypothetical protein